MNEVVGGGGRSDIKDSKKGLDEAWKEAEQARTK